MQLCLLNIYCILSLKCTTTTTHQMVASVLISSLVLDIWNPFNVQFPKNAINIFTLVIPYLSLDLVLARIEGLLTSCDLPPTIWLVYMWKLIRKKKDQMNPGKRVNEEAISKILFTNDFVCGPRWGRRSGQWVWMKSHLFEHQVALLSSLLTTEYLSRNPNFARKARQELWNSTNYEKEWPDNVAVMMSPNGWHPRKDGTHVIWCC